MGAPESGPEPEGRGRFGSRYSLFVGLAFLGLIVVAAINGLQTDEGSILGGEESGPGTPLAGFAVPDARSPLEGDANVAQDDCETPSRPCPEGDRQTPACEVRGEDVIRVCDLFDRPLVISFWFTRGGDCLPTQDAFDRVAARYRGRVNFLSVNVRDDRERVREIIAERGWRVPVGHDADGAVSNIYRVGACPTVAFAYPGGILRGARIGSEELSEQKLTAEVERLLDASRERTARDR